MSLLVQNYLQTHSLKQLEKEYGIYARFADNSNKFSLNYSQIEAKDGCPLTKQCRGLILRGSHNSVELPVGKTDLVAYGMDRFFNFGQDAADNIYWNDEYDVQTKQDGTLCLIYWDYWKHEYHVATRSVPEANLPLNDSKETFRSLFEAAVKDHLGISFDEFTQKLNAPFTYYFELCTPFNQVVIKHDECKIFLIGARLLDKSLVELWPAQLEISELFPQLKIPSYSVRDADKIVEFVNNQKGSECEGVVVVQKGTNSFKRLKIKNRDYLLLNRQLDIFSSKRNMLEFALSENWDDVSANVNEKFKAVLNELREKALNLCKETDEKYEKIKNIKEQREFALAMQEKDMRATIFDMRKANRKGEKLSCYDWIMSKKTKDGIPTNLLDQILKRIESENNNTK